MNKYMLFFLMLVGALFFCSTSLLLYHYVNGAHPHQDVDSKAYLANAQIFVQNNSFAWPESTQGAYPYYTLGYALILALIFKIFGVIFSWVIIIQVLLALVIALLLFDIGRKIANTTVGVIAYILATVNLGFLVFSQFLLAELWLSFFLVLFFHRFITYLGSQQFTTLAQAAFILGISVLIKPAALYFWPLLLPLIWVVEKKSFKIFFAALALWCIAFYLPIGGYLVQNKVTFGRWYVSALDDENIFYWFFPNVLAHKNGTDQNLEREQLRALSKSDVHKKFLFELCDAPDRFIGVWLKNVSKTWFGLFATNLKVLVEPCVNGGDISYFKTRGSILDRIHSYVSAGATQSWVVVVGYLEVLWSLLRLFLSLIGMLWLVKNHRWSLLWLCVAYLTYFSLITGHDGCARFRMLFEFILILLAALGIWALVQVTVNGIVDDDSA